MCYLISLIFPYFYDNLSLIISYVPILFCLLLNNLSSWYFFLSFLLGVSIEKKRNNQDHFAENVIYNTLYGNINLSLTKIYL